MFGFYVNVRGAFLNIRFNANVFSTDIRPNAAVSALLVRKALDVGDVPAPVLGLRFANTPTPPVSLFCPSSCSPFDTRFFLFFASRLERLRARPRSRAPDSAVFTLPDAEPPLTVAHVRPVRFAPQILLQVLRLAIMANVFRFVLRLHVVPLNVVQGWQTAAAV
jgi:hypothetical protein